MLACDAGLLAGGAVCGVVYPGRAGCWRDTGAMLGGPGAGSWCWCEGTGEKYWRKMLGGASVVLEGNACGAYIIPAILYSVLPVAVALVRSTSIGCWRGIPSRYWRYPEVLAGAGVVPAWCEVHQSRQADQAGAGRTNPCRRVLEPEPGVLVLGTGVLERYWPAGIDMSCRHVLTWEPKEDDTMTAKARLVFDVPPEEKKWIERLCTAAGYPSKVAMLRDLADKLAVSIKFETRPGPEKTE